MRFFFVILAVLVIITMTTGKKWHKKKKESGKLYGKGMVVDYGKHNMKKAVKKMKLDHLMPVVNSPDSPYKEEWKRITQYQEGKESQECQKLTCKKKEVCLLDKDTQVAKCIRKKELKRAKKLVKKFYEKQKKIRVVENHAPELGPMQTHNRKKNKKNRDKKARDNEEKATAFDQIGEKSFHSDFIDGKEQNLRIATKDNEVGNSAVQSIKPECDDRELHDMGQRLTDWFYSVQQKLDPENQLEKAKDNLLIQKSRKGKDKKHKKDHKHRKGDKKHRKRKTRDVNDSVKQCECRDPITWEFLHLDTNNDTVLNAAELKEIETNPFEQCVNTFVDKCDLDESGDLSYPEWCCCFTDYLPPCFNTLRNLPTQMIRGEVVVVPGTFIPQCTPQGYYNKLQCDKENNQCWCVDDIGTERVGTRNTGKAKCD